MSGAFSRTGFDSSGFFVDSAEELAGVSVAIGGSDFSGSIMYERSSWTMNAGVNPGQATVWLVDRGHSLSFVTGTEITLDINGDRVWGGYIMGVRRGYAFPADDTSDPTLTPRYLILECSDYNILFQKRFAYNKADPTLGINKYTAGTSDKSIVLDLVNNYLDLTGDGIQTNGVLHVGTPIEDMDGSTVQPAITFGQAMRNIALMPGAIFYFDAYKNLNYADVDIPSAPFKLSDQPDQSTSFGYGEMELTEDGTSLGNDAFVWGAALGVSQMTFQRHQNSASIADHDRWQWADFRQDLYRPESVLKRATTYVEGSVQNNRGHKDDAIQIRCRIRKPGMRAGMRVDFTCNSHGYHDVIPIRSMTIKFVNPREALYYLTLGHYLDEAWNTAEFGPTKEPPDEKTVRVCESPDRTYDCVTTFAHFDTFQRTVSAAAGTSSSGSVWSNVTTPGGSDFGVNGSQLFCGLSGGTFRVRTPTGPWESNDELEFSTRFYFHQDAGVFANFESFKMYLTDGTNTVGWTWSLNTPYFFVTSGPGNSAPYTYDSSWNTLDYSSSPVWFYVRWLMNVVTGDISGKIWRSADTEPSGWQVTMPSNLIGGLTRGAALRFNVELISSFANRAGYIENIDVSYSRCTASVVPSGSFDPSTATAYDAQGNPIDFVVNDDGSISAKPTEVVFDNFERVVGGGYGNSTEGGTWSDGGTGTRGVDGSSAYVTNGARTAWVPGATWDQNPFTLRSRFQLGTSSSSSKVGFAISDDLSNYAEVSIDGDGLLFVDDNIDFNESVIDGPSLSTGSWYLMKWELTGSTSRAKIWEEGSTEPDWQVSTSLPDLGTRTYLIMTLVGSGSGVTTRVSYINFDLLSSSQVSIICYDTTSGRVCVTPTTTESALIPVTRWSENSNSLNNDWSQSGNTISIQYNGDHWVDGVGLQATLPSAPTTGDTYEIVVQTGVSLSDFTFTGGDGSGVVGRRIELKAGILKATYTYGWWPQDVSAGGSSTAAGYTASLIFSGNSGIPLGSDSVPPDDGDPTTGDTQPSPISGAEGTVTVRIHVNGTSTYAEVPELGLLVTVDPAAWAVLGPQTTAFQADCQYDASLFGATLITQPSPSFTDTITMIDPLISSSSTGVGHAYVPGTVVAYAADGTQLTVTEIDPSAGTFSTPTGSTPTGTDIRTDVGIGSFSDTQTSFSSSIGTWTVITASDPTDVVSAASGDVLLSSTSRIEIRSPSVIRERLWAVEWKMRFNDASRFTRFRLKFGNSELRLFRDVVFPSTVNVSYNVPGVGFNINDHDSFSEDAWYSCRFGTNEDADGTLYATFQMMLGEVDLLPVIGGINGVTALTGATTLDIEVREFDDISASVSIKDIAFRMGQITVAATPARACYVPDPPTIPTTIAIGPGGSVYRPDMVRQLGWGSKFDGLNCTMASGCMALDRHTLGAKTSNPPLLRSFQSDQVGGTDLHDVDDAWHAGYGEDLNVLTVSWSTFVSMINAGRGAIVQGVYGEVPDAYSSQPSFNGPHAVYVNEFNSSGNALVYDPLASGPRWWPASVLQAYAFAFAGGNVAAGFTRIT